jgi:hypothetical protein
MNFVYPLGSVWKMARKTGRSHSKAVRYIEARVVTVILIGRCRVVLLAIRLVSSDDLLQAGPNYEN